MQTQQLTRGQLILTFPSQAKQDIHERSRSC